jgi:hypothetical protein
MSNFAIQTVAMFFFLHGGALVPVGILGTVVLPIIYYFIKQWFRYLIALRNRDGV